MARRGGVIGIKIYCRSRSGPFEQNRSAEIDATILLDGQRFRERSVRGREIATRQRVHTNRAHRMHRAGRRECVNAPYCLSQYLSATDEGLWGNRRCMITVTSDLGRVPVFVDREGIIDSRR